MFHYTKILLLTAFYTFPSTNTLEYKAEWEYIKPEEYNIQPAYNKEGVQFETKLADKTRDTGLIQDNGTGNYGDLIHRYRENGDQLLLREVVIVKALSSNTQDICWTVSITGARITSVRVFNFGRERAYCSRIDVAAGDVQIFLIVEAYQDPRVLIEIYGNSDMLLPMSSIFVYLAATPSSRCIVEGEAVPAANHIIVCCIKEKKDDRWIIKSYCLQTNAIKGDPHEINGWDDFNDNI